MSKEEAKQEDYQIEEAYKEVDSFDFDGFLDSESVITEDAEDDFIDDPEDENDLEEERRRIFQFFKEMKEEIDLMTCDSDSDDSVVLYEYELDKKAETKVQ